MKVISGYFGELVVNDENIIWFEDTIPGFDGMHKYFLVTENENQESGGGLFCWLHSAEDGNVAFALLDVFKVRADYRPEIDEETLKKLSYDEGDVVSVLNIVNIPEKIEDMTVNLLAPVVVNTTKMRGMQVVLGNDDYSLKHKVFEELKGGKKAENSSAQVKEGV